MKGEPDDAVSPACLRLEALRIHKELLDRFSIQEMREIIRHLTTIEAVLTRNDADELPVREVEQP